MNNFYPCFRERMAWLMKEEDLVQTEYSIRKALPPEVGYIASERLLEKKWIHSKYSSINLSLSGKDPSPHIF